MTAISELDSRIPESVVLVAATEFLEEAGWEHEFKDRVRAIPREPPPHIATRAFIRTHAPDVFLGDHYEAVVYLGPEKSDQNWLPTAGILKLYFNLEGQFVSEDRYAPSC